MGLASKFSSPGLPARMDGWKKRSGLHFPVTHSRCALWPHVKAVVPNRSAWKPVVSSSPPIMLNIEPDPTATASKPPFRICFFLAVRQRRHGGRASQHSKPSHPHAPLRSLFSYPMDEDESIQGREALLVSDAPLGFHHRWFQPVGVATSTPPLVVASRERDSNAHSAEILDHR